MNLKGTDEKPIFESMSALKIFYLINLSVLYELYVLHPTAVTKVYFAPLNPLFLVSRYDRVLFFYGLNTN